MPLNQRIINATKALRRDVNKLTFADPVTHIYNPLDYAWAAHQQYLEQFANTPKRILFLGMNPGPWGMAQTGVPFGEIAAARDFLNINAAIKKPKNEHPKRPVLGLDCPRSEVSGRRLWGLFADRYKTADAFFADHFVANYCPLVFMESSARNRTPDKLPAHESAPLFDACDKHLIKLIELLQPQWVIGVGQFARKRALATLENHITNHPKKNTLYHILEKINVGTILHPSPASPAANRGWDAAATQQLTDLNLW